MNKIDRRSALGIGLAAASAAMMKPAAAQTTGYKDETPWPGVVVRAYDGETPSIIPGFKTVSMRDVIMQPGSKTAGPPMMNAMICHIPEGELRIFVTQFPGTNPRLARSGVGAGIPRGKQNVIVKRRSCLGWLKQQRTPRFPQLFWTKRPILNCKWTNQARRLT